MHGQQAEPRAEPRAAVHSSRRREELQRKFDVPPPPAPYPGSSNRRAKRGGGRASGGGAQGAAATNGAHGGRQPEMQALEQAYFSAQPDEGHGRGPAPTGALQGPEFDAQEDGESQDLYVETMNHDFKTQLCAHGGTMSSHDHRCCRFYHSDRDRRRVVVYDHNAMPNYTAEPCDEQFDSHGRCSRGEACRLCHSTVELLHHPHEFRRHLCYQSRKCPRGRFCAFAHSREELLVPHFDELEETNPSEDFIAHQFKTQWCPVGGPHDWESCVYAHTYRDWRRTPLIGYASRPCPRWSRSIAKFAPELQYQDRCPRGMACPLAHGCKEQFYHPLFYKTNPCSDSHCKRGTLCAFTHGHDVRHPAAHESPLSGVQNPTHYIREMLAKHQPMWRNPPKYHALEDRGKGSGGGYGMPNAVARGRGGGVARWVNNGNIRNSLRGGVRGPGVVEDLACLDEEQGPMPCEVFEGWFGAHVEPGVGDYNAAGPGFYSMGVHTGQNWDWGDQQQGLLQQPGYLPDGFQWTP